MKIGLDKIPPDGLRIEAREQVQILDIKGEGIEFNNPIDVSLLVYRTGGTLLINGRLKTCAGLICSRCTKKYTQVLENNNFSFTHDITGMKDIDIIPDIKGEVAILLPIKPLCKLDCKGLCPNCGQDLNEKQCSCNIRKEDIRWEGLDNLKL